MAQIARQVRMVFDLNKCIGCHSCTMACKTMWTDRNAGLQYQYWNNVETRPGRGYPKDWEKPGREGTAGFPGGSTPVRTANPLMPIVTDYGAPWEYNYSQVLPTSGGPNVPVALTPSPRPDGKDAYASNWDEDVGAGKMPDAFFFYLPRICNHCTNPACVAACPRKSVYKREEDGIVLVDKDRCRGYRYCVKGCPYKKTYFNPQEKISQKCIFCYPRIEDPKDISKHSFCFTQCTGRIRFAGWFKPEEDALSAFNAQFNVNLLVYKWRVALRLHPEFGTEPNLFYVPPLSPPGRTQPWELGRIPVDMLAETFGDSATQSMDERRARIVEVFGTLQAERAKGEASELVQILNARTEADRLQLDRA